LESEEAPVYDSLLVPQSMVRNQSCCFSYFNCNNALDPFVQTPRFRPPADHPAWALAKANGTYVDIETRNVHDLNVHSVRNYLVNPAVHIPLLEYLVGLGAITKEEKKRAHAAFADVPDATLETALDAIERRVRQELESVTDRPWFQLAGLFFSLLGTANA
jgi:hypothetical protein